MVMGLMEEVKKYFGERECVSFVVMELIENEFCVYLMRNSFMI